MNGYRYLIFEGDRFYPKGGWADLFRVTNYEDDVKQFVKDFTARQQKDDDLWCQIIDLERDIGIVDPVIWSSPDWSDWHTLGNVD